MGEVLKNGDISYVLSDNHIPKRCKIVGVFDRAALHLQGSVTFFFALAPQHLSCSRYTTGPGSKNLRSGFLGEKSVLCKYHLMY